MKSISSRQNPIVRAFRELAAEPDPAGGRILLDGVHLIADAAAAGLTFESVAVAATHLQAGSEAGRIAERLDRAGAEVVLASDDVFAALSPVRTPGGIAAIARRTPTRAQDICTTTPHWILAAFDVQDPGNVGSLARSADAAGMTGLFVSGASANPFSWKALRGSMGSALRLPIVFGLPPTSVLGCLEASGVRLVAAVARGGEDPDAIDWGGSVALLVGGEGPGLPAGIVDRCQARATIPMAAGVDSLNVAVAAGVLAYAARRQRVRP